MPQIDNRFSLGNLITLATLLVFGAMAWAALDTLSTATAARTAEHELRIRALETREASQIADIKAQLAHMQASIDRLIRKMEGGQ